MKASRKKYLFGAVVLIFLAALGAGPVSADTIYFYTGNPFNTFFGSAGPGFPCAGCGISGSFTLAQPLAPNLSNSSFTPLSFTFTNSNNNVAGVTLTQATAVSFVFSNFGTDSTGAIIGWRISVFGPTFVSPGGFLGSWNFITCSNAAAASACGPGAADATTLAGASPASVAVVRNQPGTWTSTTTATPEPGTLLLLGTGLAGLLTRRRVRR